jgi:hypothetical protein
MVESAAETKALQKSGFERLVTVGAIAAAAGLFLPLLIPLVTGRVLALGDLSAFSLPIRHLYSSALRHGHSFLWTSRLFGGFYVHGEGQTGMLHPLHLLLYRSFPLTLAFNLELILSYVFALIGMSMWLHRRGLAWASGVLGGATFAFSGFMLLHVVHMNAVSVVAHLPWLLLAVDYAMVGSRSRRLALLSVSGLVASQILLGYPQYTVMSYWATGLYIAVIGGKAEPRSIWLVLSAAFAGILLGAVQLLPTLDLLAHSARTTLPLGFALTLSLHPLNLVQLVSPYALKQRVYGGESIPFVHEFGVYNGALSTIAITWALVRWREVRFRRTLLFACGVCLVGLILSLGRYGFVYEYIAALPGLQKFRAPARHIMLVHFGLAVLVALLFDHLLRPGAHQNRRSTGTRWLWVPTTISSLVALSFLWPGAASQIDATLTLSGIGLGCGVIGVMTVLLIAAARGSRVALVMLPAALAVDLGVWGYSYAFAGGLKTVSELAAAADAPPARPDALVHDRSTERYVNLLLLRGLRVARPYVGLFPSQTLSLESPVDLRVAGIEWTRAPFGWVRVPNPMPRVRIVREVVVAGDNETALSRIDIETTALVDRDLPALDRRANATAKISFDEPGRIAFEVSSNGTALLVTTERYHEGWRATRDGGGRLQTVCVYGDQLGMVIPEGTYSISIEFKPQSMRRGWIISAIGMVLALGIALLVPEPKRDADRHLRS